MPGTRKPTLAERVQSLEDWFAEAKTPIAQEPSRLESARSQLRDQINADRMITAHRILDAIIGELKKPNFSTARVENLTRAYSNLEDSY